MSANAFTAFFYRCAPGGAHVKEQPVGNSRPAVFVMPKARTDDSPGLRSIFEANFINSSLIIMQLLGNSAFIMHKNTKNI